MNRIHKWLASRLVSGRSTLNVYRHALLVTDLKRVEIGLTYWLWGCVALLSGLAWHEGYHMLSGGDIGIVRQLPTGLSHPVDVFYPIHAPVLDALAPSNQLPSLFTFKSVATHVITSSSHPVPEGPVDMRATEKSPSKRLRLALHIQTVPLLQSRLQPQLNIAAQQLLSGQLALARESFEQVLQQDPHQVIALAGMLVVTSQRGETQQREDYLSRIRQEIPDYVPEDDLFLMQLED